MRASPCSRFRDTWRSSQLIGGEALLSIPPCCPSLVRSPTSLASQSIITTLWLENENEVLCVCYVRTCPTSTTASPIRRSSPSSLCGSTMTAYRCSQPAGRETLSSLPTCCWSLSQSKHLLTCLSHASKCTTNTVWLETENTGGDVCMPRLP